MLKVSLQICLILCVSLVTKAAPFCAGIHSSKALSDSAVELELPLDERTLPIITTTDGTLKTLFESEKQIPKEVLDYISRTEHKNSPLLHSFDKLPVPLRISALRAGIISKKLHFGTSAGEHRRISGIQVKPEYQLSDKIMAGIDMASPSTAVDGKMLEFHARTSSAPGEVVQQAANFEKKLGFKPGSMHMHVVFKGVPEFLRKNPTLNSWRFVEYWRRLNLVMEMRDVLEKGLSLIDNYSEFNGHRFTNFAPLKHDEVASAFYYFQGIGRAATNRSGELPKSLALRSDSKMGWIGLWGHDKYDAPNLVGFELRFLEGTDLPPNLVQFLNSLHDKVENQKFGLTGEELKLWMEYANYLNQKNSFKYMAQVMMKKGDKFPEDINSGYFAMLNPHRSYEELTEKIPEQMRNILRGLDPAKTKKAFDQRGRLRYLLHDWMMDPILFQRQDLQSKIHEAQLRALRKWAQGQDEKSVIQEFLIESDLYILFADSVGFEP